MAAGAQPGHKGHGRPQLIPTEDPVFAAGPPEIAESEEREFVWIRIKLLADLHVTPYGFCVDRNKHTGKIVSANIPPELRNELNYGSSLKAGALLATTEFSMPARSVREFLAEISGGAVTVSYRFIAGLA